MQRIDDVGGQTFVKQKSEDVVAVVSGSLKSYFYYVLRSGAETNRLQEGVKAFRIVLDGEHIRKDFAVRAEDEAVMLVLGHVNSHTDHNDTSKGFI